MAIIVDIIFNNSLLIGGCFILVIVVGITIVLLKKYSGGMPSEIGGWKVSV